MTIRVDDVARALVDRHGSMEAMKLEKLVYYVQAWHVAVHGDPVFGEPIEAWRDGPVVDHLYQQHRQRRHVSSWPSGDASCLTADASTLVDVVLGVYGDLSGDDLSQLTHSEGPWVSARRGYGPAERSRQVISVESLKDYYRGKKLAGRRPSDLAVRGIHYGVVGPVSDDDLRSMRATALAELREGRAVRASGEASVIGLRLDDDDEAVLSGPQRSRPQR